MRLQKSVAFRTACRTQPKTRGVFLASACDAGCPGATRVGAVRSQAWSQGLAGPGDRWSGIHTLRCQVENVTGGDEEPRRLDRKSVV